MPDEFGGIEVGTDEFGGISLDEPSAEKLSLQSEMEKLRSERERGDLMESMLGGAESIVERLTPSGLLNQPLRAVGLPDVFQAGVGTDLPEPGPNFEAMMRMAGRAEGPLISGVGKLLSRTAEGLTTPESIVTLPAAAVSLPVRAAFAGQMAQHLPEQIGQAGEVIRDPEAPLSEKIAAGGAPLVTAAMLREVGRTPDWLPRREPPIDAPQMRIQPDKPVTLEPTEPPAEAPVRIKSYGEKYIEELGPEKARARIEHLNLRTQEELAKRPIDSRAVERLQQEAQNIANALDKPLTEKPPAAITEGGELVVPPKPAPKPLELPVGVNRLEGNTPNKNVVAVKLDDGTVLYSEKWGAHIDAASGMPEEIVSRITDGGFVNDGKWFSGGDLSSGIKPREKVQDYYGFGPEHPSRSRAVTAAPEQAAIREATTETPLAQVTEGLQPTKGIITGRAIEKWADDVLRGGGTHLGPDVLAAYMVKGAALIERGVIDFAEWSAKMIADHGPKIEPHLKELFAASKATVERRPIEGDILKASRDLVEQQLSIPSTEGEVIRMRKSAERATESPAIPEPVQERIATAPESFYRNQPDQLVEQAVKGMSDTELVSVPADSNLFVASRLEAANRLFNAGNMEGGYRVFEELEKQGTSFGQNINQFKRLPGTLPEHTAFVINQKLSKAGKDPLTEHQEADVIGRTKASKQADAALDAATEAWRKNPTEENARLAQEALKNAENAAINLQRFLSRYEPKSTASILKSILQGNLLTPISQTANLFGNMSFLPFRALDRTVASGMDIIDNYLSGRPREISAAPIGGSAASLRGAVEGAKKIPEVLFRGTGDTIKGETRAGLHPVEAWINQFSKNPEMPTTGGRLTLKDRANLVLEGTLGVPAEMMLRGLGAGDVPFKEAARSRVITEQLRLKKVPQSQWAMARKFPELFFDRKTMEQIQGDTLQAVFQRNSKTIGHLMNWIRGRGDLFDLGVATVAPYKLTPWNLVSEILSYNPVVAFARSAYDVSKGNSRSAKLNAGKLYVGTMLTAAGWWLYQNGLLAPSLDERTEAQKARVLSDEVLPPNHINISGLERKMKGGDPAFKPGDRTVDIFRAGGLAGSMFYMAANIGRGLEKQPESGSMDQIGALVRQSILEQARFGLNQSFLSGVEGLLTAVKDGNTDSYVRQYMNTVLSIPFPNSLATLSRATREHQPEFRAEGFAKQVENTIRNKLGFAGLDDYLPLKRGLWGEPLPQTPKGANALFYHFFDISKNRQVTDDPVPIELYRLWRSTADTRAIPSLPENTLTREGTTYALTPEQRSHYAELVGKYRRQIVDAMVINPEFQKLSNEGKLDKLDSAYRIGMKIGKEQFWNESKSTLQPKGARAGFQPKP